MGGAKGDEGAVGILVATDGSPSALRIVGSRGLGLIGGLILGSVGERVLHGANRPVLVVR